MPYLLDVNVLIAVIDGNHVHHARATDWFVEHAQRAWLACPTVENGTIRIMSGSRYGSTTFSPAEITKQLQLLMHETIHTFVADDLSLVNMNSVNWQALKRSGQITDTYLLALSVANGALLATMDYRLSANLVHGGIEHLYRIP